MTKLCSFASIHLARFTEGQNFEALDRAPFPEDAVFWRNGRDDQYGMDESTVLGALGLYHDLNAAKVVAATPLQALPWLEEAEETWHAVLLPTNHYGAVNWLQPNAPGEVFQVDTKMGPDEPLLVITTAGFNLGPDFDAERAAVFSQNVGQVRATMEDIDGLIFQHIIGHPDGRQKGEGFTLTLWKNHAAMSKFAYQPGPHRERVDWYKREHTADRTSFTRFRVLSCSGVWNGQEPLEPSSLQPIQD